MSKTLTGFDTNDPKFDMIKYIRQLRAVVRWKRQKARGTIQAATGIGKTAIAFIAIAKLYKRDRNTLRCGRQILVAVPTTDLKRQWENLLINAGFLEVEVLVINTVSLKKDFTRNVDLLIIDECHLYAADKFKRIFHRVQYSFLLGLTATIKRLDGKEEIIKYVAPICDIITQKEAILRGWISDFIEFNLAVPITRAESDTQVALGRSIRYYMSRFGDFDKMLSCMDRRNAHSYTQMYNYGKTTDQQITTSDVVKWSTLGMRAIHKRKNFLDNTEHKIRTAVELLEEFNVRTITFSQSTAFADAIKQHLKERCVVYHSNLEGELRMIPKEKVYKTKKSAQIFKLKREEDTRCKNVKIAQTIGGFRITWKQQKAISGTKIKTENMQKFLDKKVDILATAKGVDQGFDDDTVQMGIDSSRSEAPIQHTQRTGRIARNLLLPDSTFATKVFINLYVPDCSVPDSRDEKKLRKAQADNDEHVVWVDDIFQLKQFLEIILKKRASDTTKPFNFESLS